MTYRPDRKISKRAAFTLIELMLVTLLLLALIGLSAPLFKKTLSSLSARNASFNISKLMNYAQEIAVLERKNFKIAFNLQNGRYQLLEFTPSKKPPFYKNTGGRFGRLFALGQGLKFVGEKKEMVFYPDGHCDELKIKVLTGDGAGYSIYTKRFGNMVEIKEAAIE